MVQQEALFPGFRVARLDAGGVAVHAVVGGSGPALLLLHGYPQTHAIWHKVAPRLAKRFTVVAADLRGYGDSGKPATDANHAPYSKREMARDPVAAMRALGARVLQPGRDSSALFAKVEELQREQGLVPIPPFDAAAVVAGAGTVTLEFLEAVSDLDYLIIPCSGGGLLAGALVAARALAPRTRVIGVQPESCPGIIESLAAGEPVTAGVPDTIADGLTARRPGAVNMAIIESLVDEVVALPDPPIRRAMGLIARQLKLVVEGAGAIGLALVLCDGRFAGKRTGLVLSGGNVSPSLAAEVMVAE